MFADARYGSDDPSANDADATTKIEDAAAPGHDEGGGADAEHDGQRVRDGDDGTQRDDDEAGHGPRAPGYVRHGSRHGPPTRPGSPGHDAGRPRQWHDGSRPHGSDDGPRPPRHAARAHGQPAPAPGVRDVATGNAGV